MMSGKFVKMGKDKWGTTYDTTTEGLFELIDDYYNGLYQSSSVAKSGGNAPIYGGADNGYFNAIMGKEITAGMFQSKNVFTAIGAKPYDHEGVRIATDQASYGMHNGTFVGIGAGTRQDGRIPASVAMPVNEFRMPFKDLPFSYDYGLGLQALENKDDVSSYQDYVDMMSENYSDLVDKTLLRPLTNVMPVESDIYNEADLRGAVDSGTETSLTGIARVICNGKEADGSTITEAMVSPYGGTNGDFYNWRKGASTHTSNNIDGNCINAGGNSFSLSQMKGLYRSCLPGWKNYSPNDKMWAMSGINLEKMAALMEAKNIKLGEVYDQKDYNGAKSLPGRDFGSMANSYLNITIVMDNNMAFDYDTCKVSTVKSGDILLLDSEHIWLSMLTPIEFYNINNPAITRMLREENVMSMRAELRADKFIGHGRIKGLPDDATSGADYTVIA